MTSLNVVQFPDHYAAINIPESLRVLAEKIEAGEHGACHTLLWVVDAGDGKINLGLMGKAAKDGIEFSEFLGIHVLRSAYGVLHPDVVANSKRAKAGINGTKTPDWPEDMQ